MLDILCEDCKHTLIIDYKTTLDVFLSDVDYLKDDSVSKQEKATNLKVDYFCNFCNKKYQYNINDIITNFLHRIEYDVKNYRKLYIFKNHINPMSINPDNGMIFCNNCSGVDNLGNCYIDIYKQCPARINKDEL